MAHIKSRKGLNIPLAGAPEGPIRDLPKAEEAALDYTPFSAIHPHLLVKEGEKVLLGQPLIEEKGGAGRIWTSPGSGIVKSILRGEKRALKSIIIAKDHFNHRFEFPPLNSNDPIAFLLKTGLLSHVRMRPYNLPAHPGLKPKSIFVKAIESAPFTPPAELQVQGFESFFQEGLNLLSKISPVHLVHAKDSPLFHQFQKVSKHTAEGPHPISGPSLHIQLLDPILKNTEVVWTLDTCGVIAIGSAICKAALHPDRIVSLAGEGILPEHRGFYKINDGADLQSILKDRLTPSRIISGDPLMGEEKMIEEHLGFGATVICAIPTDTERKPLHFFRWKSPSFTATRAYGSNNSLSTRLHGEHRAFIDPNIYDKVMPLQIPTVPLIKAILAEDFETAEILGLLEIAPEDFALPTFICPSKVEMVEIVRRGLAKIAAETLSG